MYSHYWTIGKFADWVRGTPGGGAKTSEEWDKWNEQAKAAHPVRFWIAEEGLDYLQKFVCYIPEKLNNVRYYVNNRFVSRSHALTAHARDIRPGSWCDVGNRFLPCLFNELVDFVEVEQAWHYVMWNEEEQKKYSVPWWRSGWLRWRTWRCPEAGMAYLRWAETLTNQDFIEPDETPELTNQATSAKEIIELYTWWTTVYRNRPDAYEASGWSAYCEASRVANGGKLHWNSDKDDPVLKAMCDTAHNKLRDIEKAYEEEEELMMIRLIKIRQALWT